MMFPFMRRKAETPGVRPSNCLTPRLLTSGEALRVMHVRSVANGKTDHVDWSGYLEASRFWHVNPKHEGACRNCRVWRPSRPSLNIGERIRSGNTTAEDSRRLATPVRKTAYEMVPVLGIRLTEHMG
jgi:hypothetical protein